MRDRCLGHLGIFLLLCHLVSCGSVADPNVDSIFFDPARAQKERIEPRQRRLQGLKEETGAERIRTVQLQGKIRGVKSEIKALESKMASLDSQIATSRRKRATASSSVRHVTVTKTKSSGEEKNLIRERDQLANQVSQEKRKLAKMLKTR